MRIKYVPMEALLGDDNDEDCDCGGCDHCDRPQKLPEQAIQAECLKDALAAFQWSCTKRVGQLLVFKRGVDSGLRHFHKDTIFVIAKIFDPPMVCDEDSHSTSFGREHDLGLLAYDVGLGTTWIAMDSRFFEDYTEPQA